ncbi:hypothetical protein niasHT_010414 [Heterodera trifolii]|uniref:BTB/POZ domain-containing protein n=1 Tax=Heterodera trifolii TaxID=157864 RepID=A0ABD2MB83_9BILA
MSSNLLGRFKLMLSTGEGADVHFLVGKEKELLKAHKYVMMFASDVFESMFRFDDKNGKTKSSADCPHVIEVTDVEEEAFRVLLSFFYAEDLSELNGQNAMAVLYAANKYNISSLVKALLDFPINELPNVFLAFVEARLLNENDFSRRCLDYIDQNAKTLFESEEFLQIDQNSLCKIFERDQLKIEDELTIWNAAIRWADQKCRQNVTECSAANRRSALGPALFKIRFPLITKREFSLNIVSSCLLTVEEVIGVFQYHCHPNLRGAPGQYPMAFPCHGRISDQKEGTLSMEIEKLSEFAREKVNSSRYSDGIYIKGLPWKIWAQINTKKESTEKWLGFFLWCTAPKENGAWSCKCSATFRIVSKKKGTNDLTGKYDHVFSNKVNSWGCHLITFKELMDNKGFYDSKTDKVTLAIDFTVEEEKGTKRKLPDE